MPISLLLEPDLPERGNNVPQQSVDVINMISSVGRSDLTQSQSCSRAGFHHIHSTNSLTRIALALPPSLFPSTEPPITFIRLTLGFLSEGKRTVRSSACQVSGASGLSLRGSQPEVEGRKEGREGKKFFAVRPSVLCRQLASSHLGP